ncbi:MAG: AraC family transcriptional regulator [Kiritimatiellae bacterium]|nr:AraC family transcriptional regulator [Kiritimatiellia bacterium]
MQPRERSYVELPQERAPFDFLWRVTSHGQDVQPPERSYWNENTERTPADIVVFQLTMGGELTYRDKAGMHPVPKGHALLFSYGEDTGYGLARDATQTYRSRYICLCGAGLLEHWSAIRRQYGSVLDLRHNRLIPETLVRLIDMARPHRAASPSAQASLVYSFVMQIFDHARASQSRELSPVERAVGALRDAPLTTWSLKEVAATYGVSREHLSRVFHDVTGHTPAAYVRRARLQRARWLIENTDLPVIEIARQAGYPSTHTLARQVKAETGHSPQTLRTTILQNRVFLTRSHSNTLITA